MKKLILTFSVALGLFPHSVQATFVAHTPLSAGSIMLGGDTGVQFFSATKSGGAVSADNPFIFQGQVREVVWKESATGNLDFVFQARMTIGEVNRITVSNFSGFVTGISQTMTNPLLTGRPAKRVALSTDFIDGQLGVNFDKDPAVRGGYATLILVVKTNAKAFKPGTLTVNNSMAFDMEGFEPTQLSAVPELATLWLFGGLSLGLCGAAIRHRRSARLGAS